MDVGQKDGIWEEAWGSHFHGIMANDGAGHTEWHPTDRRRLLHQMILPV